jgi:hypothetical protein
VAVVVDVDVFVVGMTAFLRGLAVMKVRWADVRVATGVRRFAASSGREEDVLGGHHQLSVFFW